MANALALVRNFPSFDPNQAILKVAITGNYTTGGDPCDLTPNKWSDPGARGVVGQPNAPAYPPVIEVANGGGYYAQWAFAAPATVTNGKIQWFAPGGAEVAAAAYPAAILAATVIIKVPIAQ